MQSKEELKKMLLSLLLEDVEFRHAVAGAIGYREILDRFASMQEEMNKRFLELRREMDERFAKIEEEIRDLREEANRLRQDMNEGFRRHDEEFKKIDKRLRSIESYIERTSLTLEEEARDVIEYMLKEKGLTLSLSRLELPDIEIDIYGVDTEYCIVGEVKTRASSNLVERVDNDIELLCSRYPQYLRKKIIKVIYAMQVTHDAIKEGEKRGIWLVTAKGELTSLRPSG